MMRLPPKLARYFWDVDASQLDPQRYPRYVQERLLELGDETAIAWLRRTYSDDALRQTLKQSRSLSARSANFWCLVLHVPPTDVRCLNKSLRAQRSAIWPY